MAIVCPLCREVTTLHAGYITRHGYRDHLKFVLCSASGTPYVCNIECCG